MNDSVAFFLLQLTIQKRLSSVSPHPLLALEPLSSDEESWTRRQVGFCAKWCMDNLCK